MRKSRGSCKILLLLLMGFIIVGTAAYFKISGYNDNFARARALKMPAQSLEMINVGVIKNDYAALPLYGLARLSFNKLNIIEVADPALLWPMLELGSVDCVFTSLDQFALVSPRLDVGRALFPFAELSDAYAVVATPQKDAKNSPQFCGYLPGTSSQYLATVFTDLQPKADGTIKTVASASAKQLEEALLTGQLQYAAVGQPSLERLKHSGCRIVFTSSQPLYQVCVATLNLTDAHQNGEKQKNLYRLTQAWFEAIDRLQTTPAPMIKAMAEERQLTVEDATTAIRAATYYAKAEVLETTAYDGQLYVNLLKSLINDWSLTGAFLPPFSARLNNEASQLIDFSAWPNFCKAQAKTLDNSPTSPLQDTRANLSEDTPLTPQQPTSPALQGHSSPEPTDTSLATPQDFPDSAPAGTTSATPPPVLSPSQNKTTYPENRSNDSAEFSTVPISPERP